LSRLTQCNMSNLNFIWLASASVMVWVALVVPATGKGLVPA
jgi:hypothetical protein